jgi:hypothetical protein
VDLSGDQEEKMAGKLLGAFGMAGFTSLRIGIQAFEKYCGSYTSEEMELFSSDMDRADLRHGRKEIERIGS